MGYSEGKYKHINYRQTIKEEPPPLIVKQNAFLCYIYLMEYVKYVLTLLGEGKSEEAAALQLNPFTNSQAGD